MVTAERVSDINYCCLDIHWFVAEYNRLVNKIEPDLVLDSSAFRELIHSYRVTDKKNNGAENL